MVPIFKRITYKVGDTIVLKPLFDVHLGARSCGIHVFKKFLKESDKNTYFIGGGDLFDYIY